MLRTGAHCSPYTSDIVTAVGRKNEKAPHRSTSPFRFESYVTKLQKLLIDSIKLPGC